MKSSPAFPPLSTVREPFDSHGALSMFTIFEFTVASQQPEFVEFSHVELAVFQPVQIFLDDYRVG